MITYSMEKQARGGLSLYAHLYQCIRGDILSGRLALGERLPSKRALARHLSVSVQTVEHAYAQLESEGYLHARQRRGHYLCILFIFSNFLFFPKKYCCIFPKILLYLKCSKALSDNANFCLSEGSVVYMF